MQAISSRPQKAACSACSAALIKSFVGELCGLETLTAIRRQPNLQIQRRFNGRRHWTKSVRTCSGQQTSWRIVVPNIPLPHAQQLRCISTTTSRLVKVPKHNTDVHEDDIATLLDRSTRDEDTKGIQTLEDSMDYLTEQANNASMSIGPMDSIAENTDSTNATGQEYVPWYLQQGESSSSALQPTASGQELPDMPDHSPELLEPITKHTLDILGLTHLKILDLREMTDPPPALGANLIMVVATARSERHLHASADKLCRWLRTEYHMTPFADGLLGRNEMKIAIRRRARRAKMMSAVGAKTVDDGDIADGLRSGWICVNVGRVEGGVLPHHVDVQREIVGFGTAVDATTLVVQMMTEEKREEINLEELWARSLDRQRKRKSELLQQGEESIDTETELVDTVPNATTYEPVSRQSATS